MMPTQQVTAGYNRPNSEREQLGFTSNEVCAELSKFWCFSDELTNIVAQSGEPLQFDPLSLPACAVYIARYISESNYSDKTQQTILDDFPRKEWLQLGLKEEFIPELMATLLTLETGIEGLLD